MNLNNIIDINNFKSSDKVLFERISLNKNISNKLLINDYNENIITQDITSEDLFKYLNSNKFLKELKEFIEPGKIFIEIGCGTGQLSNFLAVSTLANIVGIDNTIESLIEGNQFAKKNNIDRVRFINDNYENLSYYKPDSVDYIWSNCTLNYKEFGLNFFDKLDSLLRPGGYVFIITYNKYGKLLINLNEKIINTATKIYKFINSYKNKDKLLVNNYKTKNYLLINQKKLPIKNLYSAHQLTKLFENKSYDIIASIPDLNLNYNLYDNKIITNNKLNLNKFCMKFVELINPFNKFVFETGVLMIIARKRKY